MQIKWKTIKVDAGGLPFLAYKEINGKQSAKCEREPEQPAHPDLIAAMDKLKPHFALLCEQLETPSNINDFTSEELAAFTVRGYHHSKNDDVPGITIVGHKKLKSGKVLGLNAPFLRFYEDAGDENAYPFKEILQNQLDLIEVEAKLYLGGKIAKDPQQQLDFPDDKSKTSIGVLDPEKGSAFDEKGKGKGKKKAVVTE